jgi:hypothetical protein
MNGPRSVMRTTTDRPLSRFVTRTREPSGSVLDAAVNPLGSKGSPLLVERPANPGAYHEATSIDADEKSDMEVLLDSTGWWPRGLVVTHPGIAVEGAAKARIASDARIFARQ